MTVPAFTFQPRWREELVCGSPAGSFILEMTMSTLAVYYPTESAWQKRAPAWAAPHWAAIRAQLEAWCGKNKIPLHIDETASVSPA
jgi:hypothetical protein